MRLWNLQLQRLQANRRSGVGTLKTKVNHIDYKAARRLLLLLQRWLQHVKSHSCAIKITFARQESYRCIPTYANVVRLNAAIRWYVSLGDTLKALFDSQIHWFLSILMHVVNDSTSALRTEDRGFGNVLKTNRGIKWTRTHRRQRVAVAKPEVVTGEEVLNPIEISFLLAGVAPSHHLHREV